MAVPAQPPKLTPPPFIKAMGIFLAAFNILALALAIWVLVLNRRHLHEQARIQTMNLAEVLEENVVSTIHQVDQVLLAVKDEAEHDPRGPRLDPFLEAQFRRSGLFETLQTADSDGRITHRVPATTAPLGTADQVFFRHLKQTPKAGLFISRPFRPSPGAAWNLTFARRVDRSDGEFGGVVFGHFPLEHFTRILAQVDVGRFGSVSLRAADHSLLARYPGYSGQDVAIGDQRLSGKYLAAVRAERPTVQFDEQSPLDGRRKAYTVQRVDGPGFFLFVGLGEAEYLQPWHHQIAFTVAALLGLLSLTLVIGWQARSAWGRHLADQRRLAAEEAKYRLLAENVTNVIWAMDPDGHLTYVSPSIIRQRGWTPEEFLAMDPESRALSGEYVSRIRARLDAVQHLPPGSQPFEHELLQAAVTCKDGREIEVEAQWRIVWGEDGSLLGFQGVTRDITETKRMENERERLIQELTQTLAEVKTLSGLLPICSQCKKVRDDQGYWNKMEAYLSTRTDATFTHGLCPDCAGTFRDEMRTRQVSKGHEGEA